MKKKIKKITKPKKEDITNLKKENQRLRMENKLLKELLNSDSQENQTRKGRKIMRYSQEI